MSFATATNLQTTRARPARQLAALKANCNRHLGMCFRGDRMRIYDVKHLPILEPDLYGCTLTSLF